MNKVLESRKYHLSFCTVCENKEISFKEGTICGLTKKKADFEKDCENYFEDEKLAKERIEKVKEKIYEKYPKKNIIGDILSSNYYKSSSEVKTKKVKKINSKTFKYDPIHFRVLFFLILTFSIGFAIFKFEKLIDLSNNEAEIYNFGFLFIFLIFLCYNGFFNKFSENEIKINEYGIHFKETKHGFKYKNKIVKWNEILEYGIVTKPNKNYSMYSIIFGIKTIEILEMDVSSSELSPEEYIGLINEKIKT
jgi:hypothetical protein